MCVYISIDYNMPRLGGICLCVRVCVGRGVGLPGQERSVWTFLSFF